MTGEIQKILGASDAVASLRMEMEVAECFKRRNWAAKRGIYYSDQETGKQREIDVYVAHLLDKPRKAKGVGAPIINVHIACECKSLGGTNVLFTKAPPPEYGPDWVPQYWLGNSKEFVAIVLKVAEQAGITDRSRIRAVYEYAERRAYAFHDRAMCLPAKFVPPPVELVADSFRETKGAKLIAEDETRASPVWNAVRSCLSAMEAAKARSRGNSLDWVTGLEVHFHGIQKFIKSAAFFLDAELLRNSFFHPIVFLHARLWYVDETCVREVKTARLKIGRLDDEVLYVDIVNSGCADEYVDALIEHFEKSGRKAISTLWKMLEEIGWVPGEHERRLGRALGHGQAKQIRVKKRRASASSAR